jgi:phosphomannomutase
LRLSRAEEWVHVRPSGTEPVVRVIAESTGMERTQQMVARALGALAAR